MNAVLMALLKPASISLLAGVIKFLYDYQANPDKLTPAIVDGVLTAALTASSFLGVNGVLSGVATAKANAAAKETTQ